MGRSVCDVKTDDGSECGYTTSWDNSGELDHLIHLREDHPQVYRKNKDEIDERIEELKDEVEA
ncbi:MAG: hypothetical protein ABEJ02_02940 [Candidatus Paceibacteria bacterium]